MAYRLIWHDKAIEGFRQAIHYGREKFGERTASLFANQVKKRAEILTDMPFAGPKELFTVPLQHVYRSFVVHRRYKLIYFVDEVLLAVHIVDFWTTESNPKRLEDSLI